MPADSLDSFFLIHPFSDAPLTGARRVCSWLVAPTRRRTEGAPMKRSFTKATLCTPHDTNVVTVPHVALKIGATGGALVIKTIYGDTVTLNVAANEVLYVQCKLVKSTDTVATTIHFLNY
jgi:hypothetical protein